MKRSLCGFLGYHIATHYLQEMAMVFGFRDWRSENNWTGEQRSRHVVRISTPGPSEDPKNPMTIDLRFTSDSPRPTSIIIRATEGITATFLRRQPWRRSIF